MKLSRLAITGCVFISSFHSPLGRSARRPSSVPDILATAVSHFDNHGAALLPTLFMIGAAYNVPLGIEKVVPEGTIRPVTVKVDEGTLGQLLDVAVASVPSYAWSLKDGVIDVYGRDEQSRPTNLLNTVVHHFELNKGTINDANARLREVAFVASTVAANPKQTGPVGVGGDSPGVGSLEGNEFTFAIQNVTVRDILNHIVRLSLSVPGGAVAWVVTVPPSRLDRVPEGGLWKLVPLRAGWQGAPGSAAP